MSPRRGSLVIDLRFPGSIARLKRATGTYDPAMLEHYRAMCRALYAGGRTDILAALKRGPRKQGASFAEVWNLYRPLQGRASSDLSRLPRPESLRRLWHEEDGEEVGALALWMATADWSSAHADNRMRDVQALRKLAKPTATVADLPELLKKARVHYLKANKRRAFNMLRDTVVSFAKQTLGKRDALTFDVRDIEPLKERRTPTSGLTPADAQAVRVALGEPYGSLWWALCCTGMRPGEFWQDGRASWRVLADRVEVQPSKTTTAPRPVPLLDRGILAGLGHPPHDITYYAMRKRLYTFSHGREAYATRGPWSRNVTCYDARRTFRHWCEMARIPDSRAKVYRSEGARTVDDLYKQHAILTEHLADDAAALRTYAGVRETAGLALVEGA